MRWRLSVLMFLQYAPAGAVLPLFSTRLQELGFSPWQIGWVSAGQAVAAMVTPLVAGQVADRWLPAERCLGVCAFLGAALLWLLAGLSTPLAVFAISVAFWLLMAPAISLGTSLSFTHLSSPERDFGPVRMWGTVGWVTAGWLLGYWFANPGWLSHWISVVRPLAPHSELADMFRLGALFALLLGAYALTLPHTPPSVKRQHGDAETRGENKPGPIAAPPRPSVSPSSSRLAPLAALQLLRSRAFAVYCIGNVGVCMTIALTSQTTPLFLEHLGIPRAWQGPTLTISQSVEVATLGLLPMFLLRLGIRGTMLLGLVAWTLAFAALTFGRPAWLVVASLGLHGLCISCFLVGGQVFVNSRARGDVRASAQGLISFLNGVGMLSGSLLAGGVRHAVNGEFPPTFAVGGAIAAMLALVFFLGFPDDEPAKGR